MSIDVVISTTTSQIVDTNGANGWGTVSIYPAQAFTYYDGSTTISVTGNATTVTVADGKFSSPTTVTLAPSKNASNNPETYYIVDIRVNGTFQRWLWSIPATPLAYEFTTVPRIASGNSTSSTVSELLSASDPFKQYVLRSDALDTPIAGTASDGRGYIPRGDTTNDNKLDPSWLGGSGEDGELTAADIPIVDAGEYYTGTDVEAALQEVGPTIATAAAAIPGYSSGNIVSDYDAMTSLSTSYSTIVSVTLPSTGTYLVMFSGRLNAFTTAQTGMNVALTGPTFTPSIAYYGPLTQSDTNEQKSYMSFQVILNVTDISTATLNARVLRTGGAASIEQTNLIAIRIGDPT